ncbi:hypothetical protein ACQY0O_004479 [Thecaphora frezii]
MPHNNYPEPDLPHHREQAEPLLAPNERESNDVDHIRPGDKGPRFHHRRPPPHGPFRHALRVVGLLVVGLLALHGLVELVAPHFPAPPRLPGGRHGSPCHRPHDGGDRPWTPPRGPPPPGPPPPRGPPPRLLECIRVEPGQWQNLSLPLRHLGSAVHAHPSLAGSTVTVKWDGPPAFPPRDLPSHDEQRQHNSVDVSHFRPMAYVEILSPPLEVFKNAGLRAEDRRICTIEGGVTAYGIFSADYLPGGLLKNPNHPGVYLLPPPRMPRAHPAPGEATREGKAPQGPPPSSDAHTGVVSAFQSIIHVPEGYTPSPVGLGSGPMPF